MLRYFRKSHSMAGVSVTLQLIGMDKPSAMDMVNAYPEYFKIISELTRGLSSKPRNIISTLILFERVLAEEESPQQSYFQYRDYLYEGFKYQLKNNDNWFEIAYCYCHAMHLIIGAYMPTDEEIRDLFAPDQIEVLSDISTDLL